MGEMTTRPITIEEYKNIITLIREGFTYEVPEYETIVRNVRGKEIKNRKLILFRKKKFRPNPQIALALQLEANIGLRISDILRLKVKSFKGGKIQITEKKTGELQYRDINQTVYNAINEYALERGLTKEDNLFSITTKAVHKQLKIVTDYLDLINVSTHSFRKMYATMQYELNGRDAILVKDLLNHSSMATTEKYVRLNQKKINEASEKYCIMI